MVVLSGGEAVGRIQDTLHLRLLVEEGCRILHNLDYTPEWECGIEFDEWTVGGTSYLRRGGGCGIARRSLRERESSLGSEPGLIKRSHPIRAVPDLEGLRASALSALLTR